MVGNRRKTGKEQFYTLPRIADQCTELMFKYVDKDSDRFLEPAGGEGSFIESLLRHGVNENQIISFDIEPKHSLVVERDFLDVTLDEIGDGFVTLTNPPFGRANSLSKKFFNHCSKFSEYIGFLVPKSWRKWSVQNSLNLHFHLVEDVELPDVCFYSPEGEEYKNGNLRTVFQIWEFRPIKRSKETITDYELIKKTTPEEADIAMVIFGWGCGKILREFERTPNTTMIFLKVKDHKVIDALENIDYSVFSENVAYTQALSLSEINYLLNKKLGLS